MKTIVLKRKQNGCAQHFIFLVLVLFTYSTMYGQNQDTFDEVKRLMTRAKTAYSIEEYKDALMEYQKVSKLVPDFFDIYKAIGDTYEKMGGEENLKNAIDNYKRYLSFVPDATDKESIQDKINSLEYLFEKQAEKNFILDDLKGLWVSNLVNISDKKQRDDYFSQMVKDKKLSSRDANVLKTEGLLLDTTYRVDRYLKPLMFFRMTEMGKTGKYRVEILKESAFYKESIIQKIVSIVPDKNNSIRFTFADEEKYIPSQAKWNALRDIGFMFGSAIGGVGGDITNIVANSAANIGQEGDLPSNTQTVYDFELQYNNGKLTGYCNVIQGYSSSKVTKDIKNDFYEIEFWKENDYLDKLQLLKDKEEQKTRDKKAKKPVYFGIHGGLNFLNYSYNSNKHIDVVNEPFVAGPQLGIFLEFRISDLLFIQPGANISVKPSGLVYKSEDHDRYLITNSKSSPDEMLYLDFPINLLLKYKVNKSTWQAGIGPVISYLATMDVYSENTFYPVEPNSDGTYDSFYNLLTIKRTTFGINFKLGYSIHKFFIEFGYNAGMTDISTDPKISLKNNYAFGSLGLKF